MLAEVGCCLISQTDDDRAGRQGALRAARRHRHRRKPAADRLLGDEQEAGRGQQRAGARRQVRARRVHAAPGRCARAGAIARDASARRRACAPKRSSRGWTCRSAAPSAMPSRSPNASRCCKGGGPADLTTLVVRLAARMVRARPRRPRPTTRPRPKVRSALASGAALDEAARDDRVAGRRPAVVDDTRRLPAAKSAHARHGRALRVCHGARRAARRPRRGGARRRPRQEGRRGRPRPRASCCSRSPASRCRPATR